MGVFLRLLQSLFHRLFRYTSAGAGALFLLVLPAAGPALGEQMTFTHFSADIPPTWQAFEQGPTVVITANDGSSSMSITIEASQNVPLKQHSQNISRQLDGTMPEWDGESYIITFVNPHGVIGAAVVEDMEDGDYLMVIVTGDNPELYDILDTIVDI